METRLDASGANDAANRLTPCPLIADMVDLVQDKQGGPDVHPLDLSWRRRCEALVGNDSAYRVLVLQETVARLVVQVDLQAAECVGPLP